MARRRFYSPPDQIHGAVVTLSSEESHHLIHVLRMTPGDEASVFDGSGREYACAFRRVVGHCAELEVVNELSAPIESPVDLTLAQGLAKGDKFDFIVQKATELGVKRIAPLATRYADVKLDDQQSARRRERWARISLEAVKQSGRRALVEVALPCTLPEFLNIGSSAQPAEVHPALLLFNERGGMSLEEALAGVSTTRSVIAFVGPEGGWSDEELELLAQHGSKAVSLGPRTLRTETAAIVAIALIQHVLGGLSTS